MNNEVFSNPKCQLCCCDVIDISSCAKRYWKLYGHFVIPYPANNKYAYRYDDAFDGSDEYDIVSICDVCFDEYEIEKLAPNHDTIMIDERFFKFDFADRCNN